MFIPSFSVTKPQNSSSPRSDNFSAVACAPGRGIEQRVSQVASHEDAGDEPTGVAMMAWSKGRMGCYQKSWVYSVRYYILHYSTICNIYLYIVIYIYICTVIIYIHIICYIIYNYIYNYIYIYNQQHCILGLSQKKTGYPKMPRGMKLH